MKKRLITKNLYVAWGTPELIEHLNYISKRPCPNVSTIKSAMYIEQVLKERGVSI